MFFANGLHIQSGRQLFIPMDEKMNQERQNGSVRTQRTSDTVQVLQSVFSGRRTNGFGDHMIGILLMGKMQEP